MSTYDDFSDSRFKNFLAAHKPRVWKQEVPLDMSVYSKPEPTSKTRIRSKETYITKVIDSIAQQQL
jgi:hypothetical protein